MRHSQLTLLSMLVLLEACSRQSASTPPDNVSVAAPASTTPPADALDSLDTRRPLPLLPLMANHQTQNMRDHLVAVQEIVAALASDDFASIERAAGRIGFSEQMGQMCGHMGAGAPGFTEQAVAFHHTADRIGEAARGRDHTRVLTELGATLQTCTSCHAAWKQQVVDEPTWHRLTSSTPPVHGAPP